MDRKFLLIDGSPGKQYKDMYRLFDSKEKCLEEAKKIGFSNLFGLSGMMDEPGLLTREVCGDVNVSMVMLEVE